MGARLMHNAMMRADVAPSQMLTQFAPKYIYTLRLTRGGEKKKQKHASSHLNCQNEIN
jgi:hypothetical protein